MKICKRQAYIISIAFFSVTVEHTEGSCISICNRIEQKIDYAIPIISRIDARLSLLLQNVELLLSPPPNRPPLPSPPPSIPPSPPNSPSPPWQPPIPYVPPVSPLPSIDITIDSRLFVSNLIGYTCAISAMLLMCMCFSNSSGRILL